MSASIPVKALVAEDEPVLARGLVRSLSRLWPALAVCAVVHDGALAVEAALQHGPDVIFMDIQMPERDGLDAAECILDQWPAGRPLPLIVFVTSFDRHAIAAFELAAADYVLKPVQPERLASTCQRLQQRLLERPTGLQGDPLALIRQAIEQQQRPALPPLTLIQSGVGPTVLMVPVAEVQCFQADDKYVRVITARGEHLIRTPLRELAPRLEAGQFTQVHRSVLVRTVLIDRVVRDEAGRLELFLKGRPERLPVSRSYAHLFKPM